MLLLLFFFFPGISSAPGCCLKEPCPLTGTGRLTAARASRPGALASGSASAGKTWIIGHISMGAVINGPKTRRHSLA